jgi:hypothetical protein
MERQPSPRKVNLCPELGSQEVRCARGVRLSRAGRRHQTVGLPRRDAGERTISVIEGDELMPPCLILLVAVSAVPGD